MQIGKFMNWLFKAKLSGTDGASADDLWEKMGKKAQEMSMNDDLNKILDKEIGSPEDLPSLVSSDVMPAYRIFKVLLEQVNEKDKDGNVISLPGLTDAEMIAGLEAFNLSVAPADPGAPTADPTTAAPDDSAASPDASGDTDISDDTNATPDKDESSSDGDQKIPLNPPTISHGTRKFVIAALAAAAIGTGGFMLYENYRNKNLMDEIDRAGQKEDSEQAVPASAAVPQPTAEPSAAPAPIASAEPSAEPAPQPSAEPAPEPSTETGPRPAEAAHPLSSLQKITLLCVYKDTYPESCAVADPSITPFLHGCKLNLSTYKPISLDCVDANNYPGPAWKSAYDANNRGLYTGVSDGPNVVVTLYKEGK